MSKTSVRLHMLDIHTWTDAELDHYREFHPRHTVTAMHQAEHEVEGAWRHDAADLRSGPDWDNAVVI